MYTSLVHTNRRFICVLRLGGLEVMVHDQVHFLGSRASVCRDGSTLTGGVSC